MVQIVTVIFIFGDGIPWIHRILLEETPYSLLVKYALRAFMM